MQTFTDSKNLAQQKDVNNLFGQSINFKLSAEAETGSAEVQPARNRLTGENEQAVDQHSTALPHKAFLS